MIKNIVFDIGNVLVDFCWNEFLLAQGFSQKMTDRIARASILTPAWGELDRGVWTEEELLQAFCNADPDISEEIRRAFATLTGIVRLRDYACGWVKALKEAGYNVYYLSNYGDKTRRDTAKELIFMELVDGGIMSYEVKLIKPDRAIYERLLDKYDLKAEECVFLDDSPANVAAARECGMSAIHFVSKEAADAELADLGVTV